MAHHHNKKDPVIVKLLAWAVLIAAVAAFIHYSQAIKQFAINEMSLTEGDIYMLLPGMLIFFLFWKAMSRFVFTPYLELFEAREAATSGAEDTANAILAEAQALEEKYEQEIGQARREAVKEKLDQIDVSRKDATSKISAAEEKAVGLIETARKQIEEEANQTRNNLDSEVDKLSNEIVSKLKKSPEVAA